MIILPELRFENVSKGFKDKKGSFGRKINTMDAVTDIDLTIAQGEFTFIIGSRGSGKSTLLGLAAGIVKPDKGTVYVDNVDIRKLPRREKQRLPQNISLVKQESQIVRSETVRANMIPKKGLNLFLGKNMLIYEGLMQKALSLVGMSGCEDTFPREMNMSECRRVEVAKAIMFSPAVLILDEVTEKMDVDTVWDFIRLFKELNKRGTTILMATHASNIVNTLRKRVITLSDGKIISDMEKGKFGEISTGGAKPIIRKAR